MVDDLLQHTVKNPPEKGSPEYKSLCRKAAEALRDKWETYQVHHTERLAGVFNAVSDGAMLPQQAEPVNEGQLLSAVIKAYADEKYAQGKKKKGGWTAKSKEEIADGSLGLFKEVVGDVPIQRIDQTRVVMFKRSIVVQPSNMNKKPAYRDKTVSELVKMGMNKEIEEVLAPRTVNKHLGRVGAFFGWA